MHGRKAALCVLLTISAIIMLLSVRIIAQQVEPVRPVLPPEAQKKQNTEKKQEMVHGRADFIKSAWGAKKSVLMKGNVTFTHDDTVLKSDQIEYDESTKVATSPGRITITSPEVEVSGDKGSAYFKKKVGVIEGRVVLVVKPKSKDNNTDKNSTKAKFKEPTTITCEKLEYFYKDKVANASGGVMFRQDKRTATAQKAIFDQNKQLLTLIGDVSAVDENGQTFSSPGTVVISLKEGDEWIEAKDAKATFKIDLNEED